jgi:hypothetical protein
MRLFRRHAAVDEVTDGTSTPHAHTELLVLVFDLVCVCAALKKIRARREARGDIDGVVLTERRKLPGARKACLGCRRCST